MQVRTAHDLGYQKQVIYYKRSNLINVAIRINQLTRYCLNIFCVGEKIIRKSKSSDHYSALTRNK